MEGSDTPPGQTTTISGGGLQWQDAGTGWYRSPNTATPAPQKGTRQHKYTPTAHTQTKI